MNYEQFICAMLECTKNKLPENFFVDRQDVLKNNGVVMVGLNIRETGKEIAPVIYLEEYYKKYLNGCTIEVLTDSLIRKSQYTPDGLQWNSEQLLDFHKIKDRIVYKLINAQENEKLLKEIPHLPILDFAIVFYLHLPIAEAEYGSILIRNGHMNLWKRSISVIYDCAKENTPRICPYVFCPLTEFMERYGIGLPEGCPVFVLTNEDGINGAAAILYPEMPKMLYETVGGNYYLLPSSVHEFLIVPDSDFIAAAQLREMVREVNLTGVSEEEFLSDEIYYFDGDIITEM